MQCERISKGQAGSHFRKLAVEDGGKHDGEIDRQGQEVGVDGWQVER